MKKPPEGGFGTTQIDFLHRHSCTSGGSTTPRGEPGDSARIVVDAVVHDRHLQFGREFALMLTAVRAGGRMFDDGRIVQRCIEVAGTPEHQGGQQSFQTIAAEEDIEAVEAAEVEEAVMATVTEEFVQTTVTTIQRNADDRDVADQTLSDEGSDQGFHVLWTS